MHKILITLVVGLSAGAAQAAPGNSATVSGTATATVIAPIAVAHVSGAALNFGKFTTGAGGTVIIAPNGAASTSGEVAMMSGGATAADQFTVTGDKNRGFSLTTTNGSVASGSTTLAFTTKPSANSGTLTSSGTASFSVGGTLTVPGSAPAATYAGSYAVTVTYN